MAFVPRSENKCRTILSISKLLVLHSFGRTGGFYSRVVETVEGEHEFIQHGSLGLANYGTFTEVEFIQVLHELECQGYLISTQAVHPHDTNEYVVSWTLNSKGRAAIERPIKFSLSDKNIGQTSETQLFAKATNVHPRRDEPSRLPHGGVVERGHSEL
jgi:hypothetical protein